MPVEFLTDEQAAAYGTFGEVPTRPELERFFFLDDDDRDLIALRRSDGHRLGMALQICTVRYIGTFLGDDPLAVPWEVVDYLAGQLGIEDASCVKSYAERRMTPYNHAQEIRERFGYHDYGDRKWSREFRTFLYGRAWTHAEGPVALFNHAVTWLRRHRVLLPGVSVLARQVSEARTVAERRLYESVAKATHKADRTLAPALVGLLERPEGKRVSELERLRMTDPQTAQASDADDVERHPCPRCHAQPGSPCRSRSGAVAGTYHTGRFTKVPRLAKLLRVPTPADRGPGQPWRPGTPIPAPVDPDTPSTDIRIGYARCSTLGQELDSQLDALAAKNIPRDKIFAEKISTRVRVRPKFEAALAAAREIKAHAPHCRVIFTVYEMKRLGRDAAELTALADHLAAHGLVLEMLAGPLAGIYDPTGHGRLLFAFFAAMAETERENIRESTLEGLDAAARKGKHGGRPPVITDDMLHTVLRRRANGETVEQIQPDLIIPTGRRKGQNPSLSSIYRALAEHEKQQTYPDAVAQAHADFAALQSAGSIPGQMAGSMVS